MEWPGEEGLKLGQPAEGKVQLLRSALGQVEREVEPPLKG